MIFPHRGLVMRRFKLILEYEGTTYSGWQRQEKLPTVQQELEKAFLDFLGVSTSVSGSGRTDAGVHARGQVAHVDIAKPYTAFQILGAMNNRLKYTGTSILSVEEVEPDFHARFSAKARSYEYHILNRRSQPALEKTRAWWVIPPLSVEAMTEGAKYLIGFHDFTSFRDSQCQAASPLKTLNELRVEKINDRILIHAKAPSFLHHQVRNIVGTLKRVGQGYWAPEKVKEILDLKDRRTAGPTAPAHGLYLTHIDF